MTEKEREIFSEVLELNWKFENEGEPFEKLELLYELEDKKMKLRKEMGTDRYLSFPEKGRKMFAPAETVDIDYEEVQ